MNEVDITSEKLAIAVIPQAAPKPDNSGLAGESFTGGSQEG
jgi:hypothetical protein